MTDLNRKIQTNVKARNGDIIHVGDRVDTVQGTIFEVIECDGIFYLLDSEGMWDLEPWMSPNIWIINN